MELQYIVEVPQTPQARKKFPSNYVSTTKYNIFTFLPYSLILQFRRYANCYFLVCAIMQSIPLISPLSPLSAVLPLMFVVALSMVREGFEDYKRYKSDKQANSRVACVYHQKNLNKVTWSVIKPSDIIRVNSDQIVPVDFIPLYCSSQSGISYVETSSLDGQKNLKPKIALSQTQLYYNNKKNVSLFPFNCQIYCEKPNADINKFVGKISLKTSEFKAYSELSQKNLLLRGTKLKNTEWVVGITVYTGKNTKIMKNGCETSTKISNIERRVNNIILVILLFEVLCAGISTLFCFLKCVDNSLFLDYIRQQPNTNCSGISGISFGSYFILYSTYIPISLIVSLEFVKVFQGYAMGIDKQMYCAINDRKMECHTVSINEQLGQVEYILTDKTGTLTCNRMEFKNILVGNKTYGEDIKIAEIDKNFDYSQLTNRHTKKKQAKKEEFDSRGLSYDLSHSQSSDMESEHREKKAVSEHKKQIELIFFMITTCHECLRENNGDGYHGPSPDQVALLIAAKKIGFEFLKTQNKVTTVLYEGKQQKFQILKLIEFDSVRKRMTAVVRWNGQIFVFVKGADTSIRALLSPQQRYLEFLTFQTSQMAKTGLRSLWFGYKKLPSNSNIEQMAENDIENNLNLIGASGIEDKLQDYVPQTIFSLKKAGIKFIMLTGDKLETADNIARSCKMIEQGFLIDGPEKLSEGLRFIRQSILSGNNKVCPVIDGSTISFSVHEYELLEIIEMSSSAVFCRVTPNQKAEIVKIVKKLKKLTLAIGDGANDVNMILQAHVGVGIFGEEGTRAAQVSNYAIGQFCLLWKLLLYYGRLNYMRISEMILYFFYKNMVFTIVQFAYSFYAMGSGQSFWDSWSITFYNMAFTFFPVVLRAVFEVDVEIQSSKKTLKEISEGNSENETLYSYYPNMYKVSQKNLLFTNILFFEWFTLGILQGVICLLINLYALGAVTSSNGYEGLDEGFYFAQISANTSVIIVVTLKLAINVKNWNILIFLSFLIPSIGAYILYCFLINYIGISVAEYQFTDLASTPTFYIANILAILGMFSMDLFLFSIEATKANFQNYFKKKALMGRRMTEANLHELMVKFDNHYSRKGTEL